jgi:O-antigen/teichoic acid export membrane protein
LITERKKSVAKNIFLTVGVRIIYLLIGFVTRKLIITFIASEYLGLSSLYSNLLDFLNLAELGIGVAIQVRLFQPLVEHNNDKILNVLSVAKKIYVCIGAFVFTVGIILCFFLDVFIKDNPFSIGYTRISFLIAILGITFGYLCADKRLYFESNEKYYIITLSDLLIKVVTTIVGLVLLYAYREYLIYLALTGSQTFISNLILTILFRVKHSCKYIKDKAFQKSEFKIISANLKNVVPNKLSVYVFSSTDSIVISSFIGLAAVTLYSNYILLFTSMLTMSTTISNALVSTFGKMIKEGNDSQAVFKSFKKYELAQYMFSSFTTVCMFCLVDRFITVWLGEAYLLEKISVILLCSDYFIHSLFQPMSTLYTSTEKFKEDKICAILSAIINLGFSLLLVNFIGINGVIAGTLISNIFTFVMRSRVIYGKYFNKYFVKKLILCCLQCIVVILLSVACCFVLKFINLENQILDFIVSAIVCLFLSNILNVFLIPLLLKKKKVEND